MQFTVRYFYLLFIIIASGERSQSFPRCKYRVNLFFASFFSIRGSWKLGVTVGNSFVCGKI